MTSALRWTIAFAVGLILIGLIAYARGNEHHRGDEIGSHGTKVVLVRTDDE
jgi:hypothetical protein